MDSTEWKSWALIVIASLVSLLALAAWHHFCSQRRLVQDLPTAKVAGVTLGLTEIIGEAHSAFATVSPHGQRDCVFWRQEIFVEESRSNGSTRWTRSGERRGGRHHFDLVDDTGSIHVDTTDAHIDMPLVYEGELYEPPGDASDGLDLVAIRNGGPRLRRRVKEYALDIGTDVFVIGTARLPDGSARPEIAADPTGIDPMLVTARSEDDLTRHHLGAATAAAVVALAAAAVFGAAWSAGAALFSPTGGLATVDWTVAAVTAAVALWVMAALSVWRSHTGLVRVTNRAQRAWSMLDVELSRRHALVPRLATVVEAHCAHETAVQHGVAAVRSGQVDDLPDAPSDDAVARLDGAVEAEGQAVRHLMALAESYPDLTAVESFTRLRHELTVTEERIALARHFYNDSVERLRTRRQRIPDNAVAWLFDMDLDGEFTEYWDQRRPNQTLDRATATVDA